MSLVSMNDFHGTVAQNIVMEALESVGVVNALNNRQYIISIMGLQQPTPLGMIDDEPSAHAVEIKKEMFVGHKDNLSFIKRNKVQVTSQDYKDSMAALAEADITFSKKNGIDWHEEKYIRVDPDGTCHYVHSLKMTFMQGIMTYESYIKAMFETISDIVVNR